MYAQIAQSVEQRTENPRVTGSIPELGIAEDWVPVIQKAGYNLVSDMKDVNPQKLHMDICGINKKYKLELANPTVNEVADWVGRIKN